MINNGFLAICSGLFLQQMIDSLHLAREEGKFGEQTNERILSLQNVDFERSNKGKSL